MYTVQLHCLMLHPITNETLEDREIIVEVEYLGKQPFVQAARDRLSTKYVRVLSYRLMKATKKSDKRR